MAQSNDFIDNNVLALPHRSAEAFNKYYGWYTKEIKDLCADGWIDLHKDHPE